MKAAQGGISSQLTPGHPGEDPSVSALRRRALEHFQAEGFRLKGREDWKYSDTGILTGSEFPPLGKVGSKPREMTDQTLPAHSLVFDNGVFCPHSSNLDGFSDKVRLQPLAGGDPLAQLGTLADFSRSPLLALNTAFWTDGCYLEVPAGVVLEEPIHLFFRVDEKAAGKMVAVRNLIRVGAGSRVRLIEHFSGKGQAEVLHLPVTEILCGPGSQVTHLKVVTEGTAGLHYGSTHVRQDQGSHFKSREFAMSGARVRRELHLELAGQGADCDLTALAMAGGQERRDMRTRVDHRVPGCQTFELYKGLYDDRSQGVFDGLILVDRDAQQTDAHQTNRNLLLSDDAVSYSIPRLEIYADDVKCSHGSTTGQLDDEQVFFLRSRGFDPVTARVMLAAAFANEILAGVQETSLREELGTDIAARLARSLGGGKS